MFFLSSKSPHSLDSNSFTILNSQVSEKITGGSPAPITEASESADVQVDTAITAPTPAVEAEIMPTSRHSEAIAQWSHSLQTVMDQPPAALPRHLLLAGLIFSGAFIAWAWFGQIQEVSHAQGRLVPEGMVHRVQPVAQGKITRILVQEGQSVKQGQVIAELDDRLATGEVDRLKQSLQAYRLQLSQLQGVMDRTLMEATTKQSIARAESRAQEAAIGEAEATLSAQEKMLGLLQVEWKAYQQRLTRLRPLVQEGAVAAEQLFDVEQAARDRQRSITQVKGELARTQSEVKRLRAELTQRQAEEQRSRLESQQRSQQLELEVDQLQAKIKDAENLLQTAHTQLERTLLQSPIAGTVSNLSIDNAGEVTQPGQTIAEIAPNGNPLILTAILPNREAGLVHPGMTAQIKFDAFPFQDYGTVSGRVLSISPDTTVDEQLGAVYKMKIALEQQTVTNAQQTVSLKAGQTAQAEILVRQRRIIDLILDPFQRLRKENLSL